MNPLDLSGNYKLAFALVGGMIFGFMLIKSGLTDPGRVRKLFQLRDGGMMAQDALRAVGLNPNYNLRAYEDEMWQELDWLREHNWEVPA